jgi:hypothetical protein
VRTSNNRVGFVNLFERHNKPWMNGRVSSMNLWLDWALMSCDMTHIGVTHIINCEVRLHNTWPAPELLTQEGAHTLISERTVGGHASGISSIPVITHAKASPF